MLKYDRDEVVREYAQWDWTLEDPLRFFGACIYDNPGRPATVLKRVAELCGDDQFHDCLLQRGQYSDLFPPELPRERLRLVFCERRFFRPIDFCMSKQAFERIEESFDLSQATIPVFDHQGGTHTYAFDYDGDQVSSIGLVVKLPQLFQIGNWGLSLRFSFKTKTTSALLWGWNVVSDWEHLTQKHIKPLSYDFENVVSESTTSWGNPLLLPVIFLKIYIERLVSFIQRDVARNTSILEGDFGVQSAHNWVDERHAKSDAANAAARMVEFMSDGPGRAEITSKLNTASFNAICVVANIKWAQRYAQMLNDISRELDVVQRPSNKNKSDVQQTLQFLTNKLLATQEYVDQIKSRLDLQLAMLTNYATQSDSDQNMKLADQNLRIARDTRVDSLAMKALAVVTVVFLPPSLIATIFSMSMFDWQASDSQVLAHNFWIYWAVSIPLAILLIALWFWWWNWQKNKYDKHYQSAALLRSSVKTTSSDKVKNL